MKKPSPELLRACENFMGARGGNPDQQVAYRARAMDDLIADPSVDESRKEKLRIARAELNPKPLVSLEEEAVNTCSTGTEDGQPINIQPLR